MLSRLWNLAVLPYQGFLQPLRTHTSLELKCQAVSQLADAWTPQKAVVLHYSGITVLHTRLTPRNNQLVLVHHQKRNMIHFRFKVFSLLNISFDFILVERLLQPRPQNTHTHLYSVSPHHNVYSVHSIPPSMIPSTLHINSLLGPSSGWFLYLSSSLWTQIWDLYLAIYIYIKVQLIEPC